MLRLAERRGSEWCGDGQVTVNDPTSFDGAAILGDFHIVGRLLKRGRGRSLGSDFLRLRRIVCWRRLLSGGKGTYIQH